jgi:hypothetical protein
MNYPHVSLAMRASAQEIRKISHPTNRLPRIHPSSLQQAPDLGHFLKSLGHGIT